MSHIVKRQIPGVAYLMAMRSDEYHRLQAACLAMAKQSTEPDLRARWRAMADVWLKLATDERERLRSGRRAHNTGTA